MRSETAKHVDMVKCKGALASLGTFQLMTFGQIDRVVSPGQ